MKDVVYAFMFASEQDSTIAIGSSKAIGSVNVSPEILGMAARFASPSIRTITHLARKQKFLVEDPGEDVTMPITKLSDKPVMPIDVLLRLLGAIEDLGGLCLMLVATFSGPRASEAMGFQWKSWTGISPMPYGTAVEGQFYEGRLKTKASRSPIAVPEPVRPVIEAWRRICPAPSPEALMFPTFGRGKRIGQAVPRQ